MANRPKENDYSKKVRAVAIETRENERIYMKWRELDLKVGDVLEVRILPDGEGDAPMGPHEVEAMSEVTIHRDSEDDGSKAQKQSARFRLNFAVYTPESPEKRVLTLPTSVV
jgi:hypothetical protein